MSCKVIDLFMPLFLGSSLPQLSVDALLTLFKVREWSPEGSNNREVEKGVILNWENYVREAEGRLHEHNYLMIIIIIATCTYFRRSTGM